jgi:type IV secretory pathway component VirB8
LKQIDEQRYLWCLRAFGVFIALSAALNIVLLASFSRIAPKDKLEAFLVQTADDGKQTIYVRNAKNLALRQDSLGQRLARDFIIKYIVDRESRFLDTAKNEALAGPNSDVFYMSSPETYKAFAGGEAYRAHIFNPARQVATVSVNKDEVQYSSRSGTWEAKFSATTMDANGMNRKTERKTAEIEAKFDTMAITRGGRARWRNPLGFTIVKYEIRK